MAIVSRQSQDFLKVPTSNTRLRDRFLSSLRISQRKLKALPLTSIHDVFKFDLPPSCSPPLRGPPSIPLPAIPPSPIRNDLLDMKCLVSPSHELNQVSQKGSVPIVKSFTQGSCTATSVAKIIEVDQKAQALARMVSDDCFRGPHASNLEWPVPCLSSKECKQHGCSPDLKRFSCPASPTVVWQPLRQIQIPPTPPPSAPLYNGTMGHSPSGDEPSALRSHLLPPLIIEAAAPADTQPCPLSPSLSELELVLDCASSPSPTAAEPFSAWASCSPPAQSVTMFSPASSPPITPRILEPSPGFPPSSPISPEDRDLYHQSCVGLLDVLKSIKELEPPVSISNQSPLTEEVHRWETRLKVLKP